MLAIVRVLFRTTRCSLTLSIPFGTSKGGGSEEIMMDLVGRMSKL
jgi:hypothetical protein